LPAYASRRAAIAAKLALIRLCAQPPYVLPYAIMKKTSIYLRPAERKRVARLAKLEGKTQAEVIRAAIASYEPAGKAHREFALSCSGEGSGASIADVDPDELMSGFGA
jgi:hypothetical protein